MRDFFCHMFAPKNLRQGREEDKKKKMTCSSNDKPRYKVRRDSEIMSASLHIQRNNYIKKTAQNRKQSSLGECVTPSGRREEPGSDKKAERDTEREAGAAFSLLTMYSNVWKLWRESKRVRGRQSKYEG